MKTCRICRGSIEPRKIQHKASRNGDFVLVKDLSAEVCGQCGEVYLTPAASRRIDEALASAAEAEEFLRVPVVKGS